MHLAIVSDANSVFIADILQAQGLQVFLFLAHVYIAHSQITMHGCYSASCIMIGTGVAMTETAVQRFGLSGSAHVLHATSSKRTLLYQH